jgi:hypothetical protein
MDFELEKESIDMKKEDTIKKDIKEIDIKIKTKVKQLEEKRNSRVFLFLGNDTDEDIVSDVFEELRKDFSTVSKKLDVIVDSGGGNIHAAYNLVSLFREYTLGELNFIIPRWAKSAATLMACGGNKIYMTKIAELGPLDPQITEMNPMEHRLEEYTPLQLESTLNLIREEMNNGSGKFGEALLKRLQFPMTLGGIIKSIELGDQYLQKLLITRMFKEGNEKDNTEKVKLIAEKLTKGYCDHGFCINLTEAKALGLNVYEIKDDELDIIWEIYKLYKEKKNLRKKLEKGEMQEILKEMPDEVQKLLGLGGKSIKKKEDEKK